MSLVSINKTYDSLKKCVWIYFILLIFEGALRKWVLPSMSSALLIVRDPLAIYMIFLAFKVDIFRNNSYIYVLWFITFLSFVMTLIVGHGNLMVDIYGLRIMAFHFPLVFIIGKVLNKNDIELLGKYVLYLNIFMTILVAIQFYSPQTAWINRGVGGDAEGSGFGGTAGFFRVPGTFSFTNGLSFFYGFSAAFNCYFLINFDKKVVPKWLLLASTLCMLAAIPLSISRTVFFQIILSVIFMVITIGRNPKMIGRLMIAGVVGVVLILVLNNFTFFQTATGVFTERFTSANEQEGGVKSVFLDRFLGGMIQALNDENPSFWGHGLGMGSNVGALLLSGSRGFLISEGEWGRLIGEQGLFLGMGVIFIRIILGIYLLIYSWKAAKKNNLLSWMLMSFTFPILLQGQWAQPTALGFGVLATGLVIGGLNDSPENEFEKNT
jgi:hypothetical protein